MQTYIVTILLCMLEVLRSEHLQQKITTLSLKGQEMVLLLAYLTKENMTNSMPAS